MPPDPRAATADEVVEIACDESGSEGDKLIGGTTDVFAHASVDVPADLAAAWLEEVRRRCRSPADEVKASVVLREQNRPVLRELLGPTGPYRPGSGGAHVQLVDKRHHLARRLVELLGDADADVLPIGDHEAGNGGDALLSGFNDLMRARSLEDARSHAARVRLEAVSLARADPATSAIAAAGQAVPTSDSGLLTLLDLSRSEGGLDPLVPVLAAVVRHWSAGGRHVRIVHDEHRTLRQSGSIELRRLVADRGALVDVRFVDSRDDPRVQLADFLAGAARRVASDARAGRREDGLLDLLDPYVAGSGPSWLGARHGAVLP
ncbi:MAG: DUF3800 domain-containing protein [Nocardioides sp.]